MYKKVNIINQAQGWTDILVVTSYYFICWTY